MLGADLNDGVGSESYEVDLVAQAQALALPSQASDSDIAQADRLWQRACAHDGIADPATGALVRIRQGRFDEAAVFARRLDAQPDGARTAARLATARTLLGLALTGAGHPSEGRRLTIEARQLDPMSALLPELEAQLGTGPVEQFPHSPRPQPVRPKAAPRPDPARYGRPVGCHPPHPGGHWR